MYDAHARAVGHLREQSLRRALSVVDGPPGLLAVFDSDWPASYFSNRVLVTADLPSGVGPEDVLTFTEGAFAARELDHRKIDVLDGTTGDRLLDGLVEAGFAHEVVLVMAAGSGPTRTIGSVTVETVPEDDVRGLVEEGWRLEGPAFSAETVRQLVGRRAAMDRVGPITRLAVRDPASGAVVAKADLVVIDTVAEIDDVMTLPDHRGRGYASALVLEAVLTARGEGCDLVYLQAAEDDWPQHLYTRLGFAEIGRTHELTRTSAAVTP
ncbi:MAG TPA: GNAT family N-acetyltransferase [Candidatus Limnocylindria bacterium]|nr:GNAT family N-acetyltransferase [Candidatus Limnocylindria bacterium]